MSTIITATLAFIAQNSGWEPDRRILIGVALSLLLLLLIIASVFATGSRTIAIKKQLKKLAKQLDELSAQLQQLNGKQQSSAPKLTPEKHAASERRNSPGGEAWLEKHDGF